MNTESIRQLAMDINNVAAMSFQLGKEHIERPLLAKIKQLQAENEKLKGALTRIAEHYEKGDSITHNEIADMAAKLLRAVRNE